eukprot:SAG31_NODE_20580_length_570_cov_1.148620_1_plen_100_part_10
MVDEGVRPVLARCLISYAARYHFVMRASTLLKSADRSNFDTMLAAAVHPAAKALAAMAQTPTVQNNVAVCETEFHVMEPNATDVPIIAGAAHMGLFDLKK